MTRLRGRLNTVDPQNLNQIILAEGKNMNKTVVSSAAETKILAEMIVFTALANALYLISKFYLPFLHLPQGGSITLGSMVLRDAAIPSAS